jgi:hypothetical protein
MKSIENVISEFLLQLPSARKIRKLNPGDSLFRHGLLDSQAVINLVTFLRRHLRHRNSRRRYRSGKFREH